VFEVVYQPAQEAAQVGGDWYDAFPNGSGGTMIVIGDVAGHDQDAAATMAQVRNLLRGVAQTLDGSPAAVLATLDRALDRLGVPVLASIVLAILAIRRRDFVQHGAWMTRAYAIAEVRFREGLATQIELSDARLLLQQAEANTATAARDREVARLRLALLRDLPLSQQAAAGAAQQQSGAARAGATTQGNAQQQQQQRSAQGATQQGSTSGFQQTGTTGGTP